MLRSAVLLAVSVAAWLALSAGSAEAKACQRVVAGKFVFTSISVHNRLGCDRARRKLRAWAHRGFPHSMTGWFCDLRHRRKLCSFGNGNAPYFTFRRHRRAQAAIASRPAGRDERRAIARAIRRSRYTQGLRGKFDVVHVRISTVDRRWGTARLRPKPRYRRMFDTATAVVHRAHGHWSLRTLGTADLGCVIHRRAVRRDLGLQCSG